MKSGPDGKSVSAAVHLSWGVSGKRAPEKQPMRYNGSISGVNIKEV
jgi:hypothetical protein